MAYREFFNSFNSLPTIMETGNMEYDQDWTDGPTTTEHTDVTSSSSAEPTTYIAPLTKRNLAIQRATERAKHWHQSQLVQQQSEHTIQPNKVTKYADCLTYINNVQDPFPQEQGFAMDSSSSTYLTDYTDPTTLVDSEESSTLLDSTTSETDETVTIVGPPPTILSSTSTTTVESSDNPEIPIEALLYNAALRELLSAERTYMEYMARESASRPARHNGNSRAVDRR
ncbi:uncharacterized protein GGS22DRAFT_184733 [Annulohypoxylon maeteangense]|uniref:uncharacterized protein n=1 Tax=Annulohypoxylon maeteangense TaxID=1927788 RepID=UPI00200765D9|nr:uncharacterized protein GGS22DRAFT_184733 [Annulohypoxylon maeteangense]KAI0889155.1 hypothetical protein GGS22DRAFT_184733 [Annulohypoxylon maeteangense]